LDKSDIGFLQCTKVLEVKTALHRRKRNEKMLSLLTVLLNNDTKKEGEKIMVKKSKVLAIVLCFVMLIFAMPFGVIAEGEPITLDVSIDTTPADVAHVTVTYTTDDLVVGDQITLLATLNSVDVEINQQNEVTNVAYIDQFAKDDYTGTFTFDILKSDLTDVNLLYVKMGGTNVTTPGQNSVELETTAVIYGDVTGDDVVNAIDASFVLSYFVKNITEFPDAIDGSTAADVTGDSTINAIDASFILSYFVKNITLFPVEQ
jgi:hypothetical protein